MPKSFSLTSAAESEVPDNRTFTPAVPPEAHALLAGDLGDPSYRIDSFAESLDLMRRVVQSNQAATLVLLKPSTGQAPEPLLIFTARLDALDDNTQSFEMELPLGTPQIAKGLTLRGSAKLQGVIVTFECESLGSRQGSDSQTPVLMARMPFRLYRLQRRDSFRVPLTPQSGVHITLKQGVRALEAINALDVSCGGVSVLLCAPLDSVHQGKRFQRAMVRLGAGTAAERSYHVDMLVRHVRLAPPGLSQMATQKPAPAAQAAVQRPPAKLASHVASGSGFKESAKAAMGAMMQPEWVQLGIEFDNMPTALERHLAQLVNELGVRLMTRVKED